MRLTLFILIVLLYDCSVRNPVVFNQQPKDSIKMAKILYPYEDFTAQNIRDRSSNIGVVTISGNNVSVTDIYMYQIRDAIGETSNDLGTLCTSSRVNKWSNFGPIEWYILNGELLSRPRFPYEMDNFAGYNHNAISPSIYNQTTSVTIDYGNVVDPVIYCNLDMREINWTQYAQIYQVCAETKRQSNGESLGKSYYNITEGIAVSNTISPTLSNGEVVVTEIYFVNLGLQYLAPVPGISSFTTTVSIISVGVPIVFFGLGDTLADAGWADAGSYGYIESLQAYHITLNGLWREATQEWFTGNVTIYLRTNGGSWTAVRSVYLDGNTQQTVTDTYTIPDSSAYVEMKIE